MSQSCVSLCVLQVDHYRCLYEEAEASAIAAQAEVRSQWGGREGGRGEGGRHTPSSSCLLSDMHTFTILSKLLFLYDCSLKCGLLDNIQHFAA